MQFSTYLNWLQTARKHGYGLHPDRRRQSTGGACRDTPVSSLAVGLHLSIGVDSVLALVADTQNNVRGGGGGEKEGR